MKKFSDWSSISRLALWCNHLVVLRFDEVKIILNLGLMKSAVETKEQFIEKEICLGQPYLAGFIRFTKTDKISYIKFA